MLDTLSLNTNLLSLSALLGTSSSQNLIDDINARSGATNFFGSVNDPFKTGFQNFMMNVVQPIKEVSRLAQATAKKLFSKDVYRPISSIKDLKNGIPPCMQEMVAYYPPIRSMIEEERIDGFGYNPKHMFDYDIYGKALDSGHVDDVFSKMDKDTGEFTIHFYEDDELPVMTREEKEAARITREFIDKFMSDEVTSSVDFTDYPRLHA